MSVQQDELNEARAMQSALYPQILKELARANQERDLYKARYELLESLCCIGLRSDNHDWCELRGGEFTVVGKDCKTVAEAVDFLLGGNEV